MNFWAEAYSDKISELEEFGPYTSKDVDFYGPRRVAQQLAEALNGQAAIPGYDDHTPNTALVRAVVDGYSVSIDFLDNVLGISDQVLAVQATVSFELDGSRQEFRLKLLHPLHCLISRVNTIMNPAIKRSDEFPRRQIRASVLILRQYMSDALDAGEHKEFVRTMSALGKFLVGDEHGCNCHLKTPVDPLSIVRAFCGDDRLDHRYRTLTLAKMVARIESRRARQAARRRSTLSCSRA